MTDRYEAARNALAAYSVADRDDVESEDAVVEALRALITPPSTGETVEQIAERVLRPFCATLWSSSVNETALDNAIESGQIEGYEVLTIAEKAVRAGVQYAHETWEPEVALRPTQEQMLRWLGIRYTESAENGYVYIPLQMIDREDAP